MVKFEDLAEKVRGKVPNIQEQVVNDDSDNWDDDEEEKAFKLDLTQDKYINPTPFAFKPFHLASLINPKNLKTLESMGRSKGLLAGLGVDSNSGLNIGGKISKPSEAPVAVVTDPAGKKGDAVEKSAHRGDPYCSTIEDRQRVYGPNVLPV